MIIEKTANQYFFLLSLLHKAQGVLMITGNLKV